MRLSLLRKIIVTMACAISTICAATAFAEETLPKMLEGVTIKEHLGDKVDLSTKFLDHNGKEVTLGSYFNDGKPVLLTLNYYKCKMLCTLQLNALVDGLRGLNWKAGNQFRIVTISIDPRHTPMMAAEKRTQYLESLGKGMDVDWNFLVGKQDAIERIASQVGFEYKYDPEEDQYAHGLGIYFLNEFGVLSRYLYGLQYSSRDIKFALLDTAAGKIGTTVEKFILNCFHYDETRGQYGPSAMRVMRISGLFTVVLIGAGLSALWRREKMTSLRSQNRVV